MINTDLSFHDALQFSDENMPPLVAFFRCHAKEGQALYIRGQGTFAQWVQRQSHVDIVMDSFLSDGILGIEVKLRRQKRNDILLEVASCTNAGKESDGWIYTCTADLLCYAFLLASHEHLRHHMEVNVLYMPGLQQWFRGCDLTRYKPIQTKQFNRTKSYPVPWKDIPSELLLYRGVIDRNGKEVLRILPKKVQAS